MKKAIAIIFTLAIILLFSACGDTSSDANQDNQGSGQQQEQQSSGAQQSQANESQSGTTDQQQTGSTQDASASDQQADTSTRNVALFNEFVAEYARANPTRTQGISNGVAFWISTDVHFGQTTMELLQDISTGQTHTLVTDIDPRLMSNFVYWNGSIFARLSDGRGRTAAGGHSVSGEQRIARFDMQGNLISEFWIQEYHGSDANLELFEIQDGKIIMAVQLGRNHFIIDVISADDFSVMQRPLSITSDVGHGRTEEVTSFSRISRFASPSAPILSNDKIYVFHYESGWHVIDLLTGESQEVNYEPSRRIGKFAVTWYGQITNTETNESIEGVRLDDFFTGTNFHRTDWQGVTRYNPYTMEFEAVFIAPNPHATLVVLDDEYLIVQDDVGTSLYRFVDGDVGGEFVREIILP